MSGRLIHNHGALNNSVAGNCAGPDWTQDPEKNTFAVHLQAAGYATSYAGKYLNAYALPGSPGCLEGDCGRVPPGWTSWLGLVGNSKYYDYSVSNQGKIEKHGSDYATDYFPDLVANHSVSFIYNAPKDSPILVVNAWPTPHGPHTPAPQYNGHYLGRKAPRTPNYNASAAAMQQKQWLMRQLDIITESNAQGIDSDFQGRWESLLSVDDHIQRIVQALEDTNRLDNTFIFFASDHGYQLGQHRLLGDKRHLYIHDLQIPFIVRGPGVAKNATDKRIAMNIDIAPTFVDLATGAIPDDMDGQSLVPLLKSGPGSSVPWRNDFMVEYHGQGSPKCGLYQCPRTNNTYTCLATETSSIYCEFEDSESFIEYYDMTTDPWQLSNTYSTLPSAEKQQLRNKLNQFRACKGVSCRTL